jgi:peptidoglycan/LPS O-acetylase OafA/YrhL
MDIPAKHHLSDFKTRLCAGITEVPQVLQQSHFPGLDGLRGISILVVTVCHFAMYTPLTNYLSGDIGVEIFFVISGFLITSLLLKEKVKRIFQKLLHQAYPSYYACGLPFPAYTGNP